MTGFNWAEYLALMAVFGIGAVSPGPDFAMVLRQSIAHGRAPAIATSAGIASAIFVHGAYTILGLGLVIAQSLWLFTALKFIGAAYLLWLGISALRAPAPTPPQDIDAPARRTMPLGTAYRIGFLTNLLNPKAVLFFLSLFTTLVSAKTLVVAQGFYVGSMAVMLFVWFALVSVFFTTPAVRGVFYRLGQWFNRLTGLALIALALRVALTQRH
ncbi:LysE family translocator [Cucumibacter marinus]|uniref:LysE family translocator n=1 Tax=Cucumibacter marinus TaxID=1121252 RepID=UPI0003F93A40|nr:LysE family transporter [Cucumibacter marinus]